MTTQQVLNFCKRNQLRAVVIVWYSPDYDWRMFRIERVLKDKVALTGMTNTSESIHDGSFFWCKFSDIKSIKLRR